MMTCSACEAPLPPAARKNRRYCGPACRMKAHRKRNAPEVDIGTQRVTEADIVKKVAYSTRCSLRTAREALSSVEWSKRFAPRIFEALRKGEDVKTHTAWRLCQKLGSYLCALLLEYEEEHGLAEGDGIPPEVLARFEKVRDEMLSGPPDRWRFLK